MTRIKRKAASMYIDDLSNVQLAPAAGKAVVIGDTLQLSNGLQIVGLAVAITANVTTTTVPAGSIGITSHATGRGKLFVSDGAKWQFAAVA